MGGNVVEDFGFVAETGLIARYHMNTTAGVSARRMLALLLTFIIVVPAFWLLSSLQSSDATESNQIDSSQSVYYDEQRVNRTVVFDHDEKDDRCSSGTTDPVVDQTMAHDQFAYLAPFWTLTERESADVVFAEQLPPLVERPRDIPIPPPDVVLS
ncbi:hypothetical protein [Lysinibacter cavernae]|uniref:Dipeptide/tripeptide permease n=1 Tax=Lysinibacter cavernae TaxID=1640652 RepID=A0A7X5TTH8_9MICO|nr:hypothetical protein [Lysinibacter cavernae]NIH54636.1 dipeptide/tripeptide permease [Lysinibacter cavernae]